jgi:hypothetical protein
MQPSLSFALKEKLNQRLFRRGVLSYAFESTEITLPWFDTDLNLPHVPSEGSLLILCVPLSK